MHMLIKDDRGNRCLLEVLEFNGFEYPIRVRGIPGFYDHRTSHFIQCKKLVVGVQYWVVVTEGLQNVATMATLTNQCEGSDHYHLTFRTKPPEGYKEYKDLALKAMEPREEKSVEERIEELERKANLKMSVTARLKKLEQFQEAISSNGVERRLKSLEDRVDMIYTRINAEQRRQATFRKETTDFEGRLRRLGQTLESLEMKITGL